MTKNKIQTASEPGSTPSSRTQAKAPQINHTASAWWPSSPTQEKLWSLHPLGTTSWAFWQAWQQLQPQDISWPERGTAVPTAASVPTLHFSQWNTAADWKQTWRNTGRPNQGGESLEDLVVLSPASPPGSKQCDKMFLQPHSFHQGYRVVPLLARSNTWMAYFFF